MSECRENKHCFMPYIPDKWKGHCCWQPALWSSSILIWFNERNLKGGANWFCCTSYLYPTTQLCSERWGWNIVGSLIFEGGMTPMAPLFRYNWPSIPKIRNKKFDRSIYYRAADSWNKLIPSMTLIDSRPGFKRLLDGLIVNPYTEDD